MTLRQGAGDSPICPVRRRSRVIAFCPSFNLVAWWSLRVSCESSHTPSHLVTALLNGSELAPTATATFATFFFLLFFWNRATSILPWSNATPFSAAHPIEAVTAPESFAATSVALAPSAHQLMSSTKDRPWTPGMAVSTTSKYPPTGR